MKCSWRVIQFGQRQVPGESKEADGDEEMDGGGILIISHSRGGSRAGNGSPTGVMMNFIVQYPNQNSERLGMDFAPRHRPWGIHRRRGRKVEWSLALCVSHL